MHARLPRRCAVLLAAALLAVGAVPVLAQSPSPTPGFAGPFDPLGARSECEEKGGTVQTRQAAWNTNADASAWLLLDVTLDMCRFQMLGPDDDSRIFVDLRTLTAHGPTLATVAYLAASPVQVDESGADPAWLYCENLGGASLFGSGAAGGGWVLASDPLDPVLAMCVFADGSMIDLLGLQDHANGIVRGMDLALVLDYQPSSEIPPIFPGPAAP